jgi:hypothetical protein
MLGEARDLEETFRAQNRLRGREALVHAIATQVLIGWCATATGQTCGEVAQRLALALNEWLDDSGSPPGSLRHEARRALAAATGKARAITVPGA